jgi:rsbT co-antagonist protein RsbR
VSDPAQGRFREEDLALLRALGGGMSQIIHGEDVDLPDLQRRDELGILANMVARLARELRASRRRDAEHREELVRRVEELSAAYATQEKLLVQSREVAFPVLELSAGLVLVPLSGALDTPRVSRLLSTLLAREGRAEVVILHLAVPEPISADRAARLLRLGQSLRHAGARGILSGAPPALPPPLAALSPCETLPDALAAALDLLGYRMTR